MSQRRQVFHITFTVHFLNAEENFPPPFIFHYCISNFDGPSILDSAPQDVILNSILVENLPYTCCSRTGKNFY